MSYLQRWRKYNTEVQALAQISSSESEPSNDDDVNNLTSTNSASNSNSELQHQSDSTDGETDTDVNIHDAGEHDFGSYQSDSSSDSCDASEEYSDQEIDDSNLSKKLAICVTKHRCTRICVNEMLGILREHGHRLPKDARTLLQTPRFINVEEKCGGQYLYLGIESGILKVVSQYKVLFKKREKILLNFNIDGVPLFKSSNAQLWPILCSIQDFDPFVVAIYYGNSKPNSIDEYLADFLNELKSLSEVGVDIDGNTIVIPVKINAFICDAPARSFLKCTKGHNAYYSCERCTIKGVWRGRVVFDINENLPSLRTEHNFRSLGYPDHQTKKSPLIDVGLSCINSFALDYMHLVCLGVVKRIMTYLKQGPRECKLSQQQLSILSEKLCTLNGKMPRDFARQPRSLHEIDKWKATEYRQFLLYTGPLVLRSVLSDKHYHHFLTLTVALSILLDSNNVKRNAYLGYAKELLVYFVKKGKLLYGDTFTSYNVHSLIHLADDVEHFKTSLNEVCAFQFENHLQILKKSVKKAQNPIAQIVKRISEIERSKIKHSAKRNFQHVSCKKKDSCFLLKNASFAFVKERRPGRNYVCDVIKQNYLDSFFTNPCNSKLINIVVAKNTRRHIKRKLVSHTEMDRKVVCLPYDGGHLLMPLLHAVERH